jgi:hypothetical protein
LSVPETGEPAGLLLEFGDGAIGIVEIVDFDEGFDDGVASWIDFWPGEVRDGPPPSDSSELQEPWAGG